MKTNRVFFVAVSCLFSTLCLRGAETDGDDLHVVPSFLFGQNLEHTRATMEGGLSAQLVRNRKFAGKPSQMGVASGWRGFGDHAVFDQLWKKGFTRHAAAGRMFRQNEVSSQYIESLAADGEAGISQSGMALRGGIRHSFRAHVRTVHAEDVTFFVRIRGLVDQIFTVRSADADDWKELCTSFVPATNMMAVLQVGVKGRTCGVVGVVSVMPDDNFHGMRADVVAALREIGTSIVRWPGGNFAGEYRWRDGLIHDRDARAPLQSHTEIETQPYSFGYDQNDIATDDVLALCEHIGAIPYFTINAAWDSPEESAAWVRHCSGRVKMWSLGNEMGYAHMEGPKGPEDYVKMVRPHAQAMRQVDPSIELTGSGQYPWGGPEWIEGAAKPLADVAPCVSYHQYASADVLFDFTTSQRTADTYRRLSDGADAIIGELRKFRALLPRNISISLDEWNIWHVWYRDDGIAEGIFTAKVLHGLMREWRTLGISRACYFQAINEKAIYVDPFGCRLTSVGEAFRLEKDHVGRIPILCDSLPQEVFVTDGIDGSRYATFYNFSTVERRTFSIPTGGLGRVVHSEMLSPDGLPTGCRYRRGMASVSLSNGMITLSLPPAALAAVRLN